MAGKQPGKHWWAHKSDHVTATGQLRSVFCCRACGVLVDTPGGFPASRHFERWNGQMLARYAARPPCN
jgi:hypothetical protein